MALPSSSSLVPRKTEFDVLREKHKFIRENDASSKPTSWEDALAVKYESSLFKEFAVCDLKHYKSGNVALRWRTEAEVLSGAGEETCGNTRCAYHEPQSERALPRLAILEVPFAYSEHGEAKSALVKLVLCEKCSSKLLWKRRKEKAAEDPGIACFGDKANNNGSMVAEASTSTQDRLEKGSHYSTSRRGHYAEGRDHRRRTEHLRRSSRRSSSKGRTELHDDNSGQRHGRRRRPHPRSLSVERRSVSPEHRTRE